jgi:hypothetical protein
MVMGKATLVHDSPAYQLYAERIEAGGLVSVVVWSVWPQTRQKENSTPHTQFNVTLPSESIEKLANVFLGK